MTRTLAVRLDALGDVLLAGPAIRALAATSSSLSLLAGPRGYAAAELLPGVDEIIRWQCPWIDLDAPPIDPDEIRGLTARLRGLFDRAVIFTSFHQSPLPTALLLRMAGVDWIGAISEDFPGRLLDLRHRVDGGHEVERALSLAEAAGGRLPDGDDGQPGLREPLPVQAVDAPYVVLHPGTSAPARAWPAHRYAELRRLLTANGRRVVVTGTPQEQRLTAEVAGGESTDLGGQTRLPELASVLAGADAVVCGNTGAAHLASAVGTPVVSLFAPTVPAERWAPYGVPHVVLGDQYSPCAGTRALECPVPGHPCLTDVTAETAARALESLTDRATPDSANDEEVLPDAVRS